MTFLNTQVMPFILITSFFVLWSVTLQAENLGNPEAVIPSQCYTKTDQKYNPCYICHQSHPEGERINHMNDGDIQGEYSFSSLGETNQWTNLFRFDEQKINQISDSDVLSYIRQENYSHLIQESSSINSSDIYNIDIKDLDNPARAFDQFGFAIDGSWWVAFNYKPLPSTFWPTNGSFDDVMIRLPKDFRITEQGEESRDLYLLNLSLVEMTIKGLTTISVPPTDERLIKIDANGDGRLSIINNLPMRTHYLGAANNTKIIRQQYPTKTEFLHSLRYLDVDQFGNVIPSKRMKELRYSVKYKTLSENALKYAYNVEHREKAQEKLPVYAWSRPYRKNGINNKMGWHIKSWIEDKDGSLRLANYEENFFCMGCHTTIGTTIDQTFSFPRKVTGANGWGYINLKGMKDAPNIGETSGEILTYLNRVGGGDEFRQNSEMIKKWFKENGKPDTKKVKAADVYELLSPSPERALKLNKAYKLLVEEQSFIHGRDAVLGHPKNVFKKINQDSPSVLPKDKHFYYDLRLNWE